MKKHYRRGILITILMLMVVIGAVAIRQSVVQAQSATVLDNMPGNDQIFYFMGSDSLRAILIDVPADQDYDIENIQLRLFGGVGTTATVSVYTDGGNEPGALIGNFETHPVPTTQPDNTVIFNPLASIRLLAGQRYWFVVQSSAGITVFGSSPAVDPSGIFTFVDHRDHDQFLGIWFAGNDAPSVAINAAPVPIVEEPPLPPSSDGNVVVTACRNTDGRLNSICEEPYQTAAIYCRGDGAIDVYAITDGEGWLAFRTTQSEIEAVGVQHQNAMIEQSHDGKIRLYRLSTGEFQVNAPIWDVVRGNLPDGYVFEFEGCG